MDLGFRHITQLAIGGWQAEVLYTMAELDAFARLSEGEATASQFAARLDTDPDATEALLDAAVALRLVEKDGARYRNSGVAARLLTGADDESLVEWVRTMGHWARRWSDLTTVVRTGRPGLGQDAKDIEDPSYWEDLEIGFYRYAVSMAEELVQCVPEPPGGTMIDLGGGCGAYSMALCARFPQLTAEVWEQSGVVPTANKVIARRGFSDRVTALARDYTTEDLGTGRALVLASNVLHHEPREVTRRVLAKVHRALAPGGRLVINNNLLEENRTAPPFAALHNLSSVVLWQGGRDFSHGEIAELLRQAGFAAPSIHPIVGGSAHVVVASR